MTRLIRARVAGVIALVVTVGACGSAKNSFMSPIDLDRKSAFSCAMEQLSEAGYNIRRSNQEAGLIRGRRESSGTVGEILSGEKQYQIIEVSIFQKTRSSNSARHRVNVATASGSKNLLASELGGGSMERGGSPSDRTREDARSLIRECGGTVEGDSDGE